MRDSLDNECQPGQKLYTFGVLYSEDDGEEVDIWASNAAEARRKAEDCAKYFLEEGWTEIISMAPGGSGGLVTIYQL